MFLKPDLFYSRRGHPRHGRGKTARGWDELALWSSPSVCLLSVCLPVCLTVCLTVSLHLPLHRYVLWFEFLAPTSWSLQGARALIACFFFASFGQLPSDIVHGRWKFRVTLLESQNSRAFKYLGVFHQLWYVASQSPKRGLLGCCQPSSHTPCIVRIRLMT